MSVKVVSKILSPEAEWRQLQDDIAEWQQKQANHDRFEEHYSFTTPAEMWVTMKSCLIDIAAAERETRRLQRENDQLARSLKGHRQAIEELEAKVRELEAQQTESWSSLS